MRKGCLDNCFPCGNTQELTSTFVRTTPKRKCLSIVATSKTHPHTPRQPQPIATERNHMKKSHLHLIPRTSAPLKLSQTKFNNQIANPEIDISIKKQQRIQIIQQPIEFLQQRSKSNVAYSILSERAIHIPIYELNEEQQKQTSLYGGAKGIIERLSTKVPQHDFSFNSDSIFQSNEHSKLTQQIAATPKAKMVPFSMTSLDMKLEPTINPFKSIIIGNKFLECRKRWRLSRLLGKGKYCHINMCHDKSTGSIYALKDIFKQSTVPPQIYRNIYKKVVALEKIEHPNIVSIFLHTNQDDRISVLQEYTPSTLTNQMELHQTLPLDTVKSYLSDLIQAIATLHDVGWIHGNINLSQVGVSLGTCKLRCSLTHQVGKISPSSYLGDIHSLAIVGFQMAFGLSTYSQGELGKIQIKLQLSNRIQSKDRSLALCEFLLMLLSIEEDIRLSASLCFNHHFFETK